MHKYRGNLHWADYSPSAFSDMVSELTSLHVKYVKQLLEDLNSGYIRPWSGDYHRRLMEACASKIFEEIVL